jgi:hypothetical protein
MPFIVDVDNEGFKVYDSGGTLIDPAKEGTLNDIKSILTAIRDTSGVKKITDALPVGTNWIGKVQLGNGTNTVEVSNDGGIYRLEVFGKVRRVDGTVINPSTEETLASIKDTDGIKKITDALPTGDNWIGKTKVGDGTNVADILEWDGVYRLQVESRAASQGITQKVQVTDDGDTNIADLATNNGIHRLEGRASITSPDGVRDAAVIADNSINRLETRATLVGQVDGVGSEEKVTTVQDTEDINQQRLQTEARLAPGSQVNIGTGIPSDPSDLALDFCKNGGSENLLVDGTTPVTFTFPADGIDDLAIQELMLVFAADDFEFDGASFGPNTALSVGVEIKTTISAVTTTVFTIKQNEDFLRIPGRPPLVNNTGPKDILGASFGFGGLLKLAGGSADKIEVVVNDNLTSVKFKYFTATVFAAKVA